MYSVVLMAALTTGMDLPDRGRRGGCCGCYGGGWGYGCCGCYGGWGMGYGGCMGYGCMGYGGCYGGYGFGYGGGVILQRGITQPSGERAPKPREKKEESLLPAPATIVVDLPADAKLLIDNEATTSTGGSRVFQSPIVNPGKEYQYTFTAEVVRDGKPIKAEQVVSFKAGQTIPVKLTLPTLGVAQR